MTPIDPGKLAVLRYYHEEKGDMARCWFYEKLRPILRERYPQIMQKCDELRRVQRELRALMQAQWPYDHL